MPAITDDDTEFELPSNWVWCRLQCVTSKITDGDHKTPPRINSGQRMLSAKNVRDGFLDFDSCDYISFEHYENSRERCLPETGDLLIVSVGGTIGRSSLVGDDSQFSLVRSVALIKPVLLIPEFLKLVADSPLMQRVIHSHKRGGAQPCLYLSEISKFPFPLPPLSEQKRIVTKVLQILKLSERLRSALVAQKDTEIKLCDSFIDR